MRSLPWPWLAALTAMLVLTGLLAASRLNLVVAGNRFPLAWLAAVGALFLLVAVLVSWHRQRNAARREMRRQMRGLGDAMGQVPDEPV